MNINVISITKFIFDIDIFIVIDIRNNNKIDFDNFDN